MRRAFGRVPRLALVLTFFAVACAVPAFGQRSKDKDQPWYDVPALDQEKPWVQWIAAFLFTAGCAGIGFKNPHRTHLD